MSMTDNMGCVWIEQLVNMFDTQFLIIKKWSYPTFCKGSTWSGDCLGTPGAAGMGSNTNGQRLREYGYS